MSHDMTCKRCGGPTPSGACSCNEARADFAENLMQALAQPEMQELRKMRAAAQAWLDHLMVGPVGAPKIVIVLAILHGDGPK